MTEPTSLAQHRWPAVFAHQFLPRVIFGDTAATAIEMFGNPKLAPLFIRFLVDNVAQYLGFAEGAWKTLAADIHLHRRQFGTFEGTVLEMPPPQIPPDCHFIAVVPLAADQLRCFTLERCFLLKPTMLCEWRADRSHANFGIGPEPEIDLFVAAVAAKL
jgi:hypothetical protein